MPQYFQRDKKVLNISYDNVNIGETLVCYNDNITYYCIKDNANKVQWTIFIVDDKKRHIERLTRYSNSSIDDIFCGFNEILDAKTTESMKNILNTQLNNQITLNSFWSNYNKYTKSNQSWK